MKDNLIDTCTSIMRRDITQITVLRIQRASEGLMQLLQAECFSQISGDMHYEPLKPLFFLTSKWFNHG